MNVLVGRNNSGKTYALINMLTMDESKIIDDEFKKEWIEENFTTIKHKLYESYKPVYIGTERTNYRESIIKKKTDFEENDYKIVYDYLYGIRGINAENGIATFLNDNNESILKSIEYIFYDEYYINELVANIQWIFSMEDEEYEVVRKLLNETRIQYKQKSQNNICNELNKLSDGIKSVISIYASIVYYVKHMTNICMSDDNKQSKQDEPCSIGKVYIDEFENHLYPNTQINVLKFLEDEFGSKLEITITTHSPLIITYLNVDKVYKVETGYRIEEIKNNLEIDQHLSTTLIKYFDFSHFDKFESELYNWIDQIINNEYKENELNGRTFHAVISEYKSRFPKMYNELFPVLCKVNRYYFYIKKAEYIYIDQSKENELCDI